MDPHTLADSIARGTAPAILDVRSRAEYQRGHIPGAVHIPFWLLSLRMHDVPARPDEPLVVYCGHGPRAWMARAVLERHGYTRIDLLTGHMHAWRSAGNVESSD